MRVRGYDQIQHLEKILVLAFLKLSFFNAFSVVTNSSSAVSSLLVILCFLICKTGLYFYDIYIPS